MKRREMSFIIKDYLDLIGTTNVDNISTEDMAEYILGGCCETFGMLPPPRKATVDDYANLGFDQQFLDEHDFTVNKWEQEETLAERSVSVCENFEKLWNSKLSAIRPRKNDDIEEFAKRIAKLSYLFALES